MSAKGSTAIGGDALVGSCRIWPPAQMLTSTIDWKRIAWLLGQAPCHDAYEAPPGVVQRAAAAR